MVPEMVTKLLIVSDPAAHTYELRLKSDSDWTVLAEVEPG